MQMQAYCPPGKGPLQIRSPGTGLAPAAARVRAPLCYSISASGICEFEHGCGQVAFRGNVAAGPSSNSTLSSISAPSRGSQAQVATHSVRTSPLSVLQRWSAETRQLRKQLGELGLAGVVAYGLLNTLYYSAAFSFFWFYVAKVPSGLGAAAAARRFAEVFALVWAGSQVTKLARAAGALALAPLVDRGMAAVVSRLGLRSKRSAFWVIVAACLGFAAALFGGVIACHA